MWILDPQCDTLAFLMFLGLLHLQQIRLTIPRVFSLTPHLVTAEESESPLTESKSVVLPVTLRRSIARLFRAVNQALQILFSPKLHIAGMTITHSPLALWTFGFTLCSHSLFNCLTHRGCLIFLSRIVPSAANLSCLSFRAVKHISPCLVFSQGR